MREACKYVEEKLAVKVLIPGLWPSHAYYADLSSTHEVVHLNTNLAALSLKCRIYLPDLMRKGHFLKFMNIKVESHH